MKLKLQHIIGISLVFCGWLGFASCTDESFESPREEEDNSIFLTFRTAVAGASTRNPDGSSEADAEIRQLLVVIVSEEKTEESTESANGKDWVVEHSRLITKGASIGIPLSDEYTFKVTTGCRKRIYLIANHKGLKDADGNPLDFGSSSFIPDESGIAQVENFVFALDWDGADGYKYNPGEYGIPMTAMYEIEVPARKDLRPENTDEYELGKTLYVVRAATKYSFNFKNTSAHRNIQVNSVDIKDVITNRMYLMPHVNKEKDNTDGTDKYWVVPDKATEKKYLPNKTDSWFTNREWIDWMAAEAEQTNGNATLPADNEEWLTDYEVPEDGITCTSYNMKYTDPVKVPANTNKKEEKDLDFVSSSQYFYLPESRSQKDETDELMQQEYTLTIHTTETFKGNGDKNSREESYTDILPHLASLFRNTHVKVNIVFNDHDVDWQVDVEPYWEVKLDPEFGLDDPETTTPEQPTNPDPSGGNSGE